MIKRLACSMIGLGILSGCATTAPSKTQYSHRQWNSAPTLIVHTAEQMLQDQFGFQLAQTDDDDGRLLTHPKDVPASDADMADRWLPRRQRLRHRAEVRVLPLGAGSDVYCRVVIEKRDAEAQFVFGATRDGLDTPGDTPIDRGEAATDEQNTLWSFVRRDKALERSILAALEQTIPPPGQEINLPPRSDD